jgi:hypothetical protein
MGKGVSAINKSTGELIWDLPGGAELLAEAEVRAYIITEDSELVVMDNRKARVIYSVNFAPVSRYAVNLSDSKIYVADGSGRISCVRPRE